MKIKNFNEFTVMLCFLLSAVPLFNYAQNGAFEFDGVDDVITFKARPAFYPLTTETTVEISFKLNGLKDSQILLFQLDPVSEQTFEIGINSEGNIYTVTNGREYIDQQAEIEAGTCYHLSIIYAAESITFYLNGLYSNKISRGSVSFDIMANETFYIGKEFNVAYSGINGLISELRVFADKRSDSEISNYSFTSLDHQNDNIFVSFLMDNLNAGVTLGNHLNHSLGVLGNGATQKMPVWQEDVCLNEYLPESVASVCRPTPPCNGAGLLPNELLCNGSFDQYCSALLVNDPYWAGQFPSWAMPHDAFKRTSQGSLGGTDVPTWTPTKAVSPSNTYISSPDFYVPYGIGSQTGNFNIFFPHPITSLNIIQNPPTTTWSGNSTAGGIVGLSKGPGLIVEEGLQSPLRFGQNLKPDQNYTFTGWFYKTNFINGTGTLNGDIQISFTNGTNGSSEYIAGTEHILHWSTLNTNNHWQFVTISFTTPPNLAPNFNVFAVKNNSTNGWQYIFGDDFSLKEEVPTYTFPQHILAGDNTTGSGQNDAFNKRIKVDANDNVYVLQSLVNENLVVKHGLPVVSTLTTGNAYYSSLITKYNSTGSLLWKKLYKNMLLRDFAIDPTGDLIAVGKTERQDIAPASFYMPITDTNHINYLPPSNPAAWQASSAPAFTSWANINYVGGTSGQSHSVNVTFDVYDYIGDSVVTHIFNRTIPLSREHTNDVVIAEISASNGSLIGGFAKAYGHLANEEAVAIEIINNTAYIATRTDSNGVADSLCTNNYAGSPPCTTQAYVNFGNPWIWGPNNSIQIGQEILDWDLNNRSVGKNVLNFAPPAPQNSLNNINDFTIGMLDKRGNHLYVLMNGALAKYNGPTGSQLGSIYLPAAQQKNMTQEPRYLHVAANGKLYIAYRGRGHTNNQNLLEQRSAAGLNLLYSALEPSRPLSISSNQDNVYVSYWKAASSGTGLGPDITALFAVDKLDAGNATDPNPFNSNNKVWSKQAYPRNVDFPDFHTFSNVNADMVFGNTTSHLYFVNHFRSVAPNWAVDFDQKSITSAAGPSEQEVFIAAVYDLGYTGIFKKDPNLSDNDTIKQFEYSIYPNPATQAVSIETTTAIKALWLTDMNGRTIITERNVDKRTANVDLSNLAVGTYIIKLQFKNKIINELLVKK